MAHTIFIDGEAGTTGLQIRQRLAPRRDLQLVSIDPEKRKEYDQMRSMFAGGFPAGGAGGGYGFPGGFGGTTSAGGGGFDISDLFGGLFGGGGATRGARRATRGADLETEATIDFGEAVDGTTVALRMSSDAACPTCHGTGGKPGTTPHVCPTCDGYCGNVSSANVTRSAGATVAGTAIAFGAWMKTLPPTVALAPKTRVSP